MIPSPSVEKNIALLPVSRFKFSLIVQSPITLSKNSGSTLRGGFGNALKEVCCTVPRTACSECTLFHVCAYPYLFETPPPKNGTRMSKGKAIPRPFVIEPPDENKSTYQIGEELTFILALIGKAIDALPYFTRAFEKLGEQGLGKGRGTFKIKTVQELRLDEALPRDCKKVRLKFLSPTRIVLAGHPVVEIDFPLFFRTLYRRIENLRAFHGLNQGEGETEDLLRLSKKIRVQCHNLRWNDQERYSRRQGRVIPQGGFVGEIVFEGEMDPFLPFLKLGEIVHVGKGATFGMGRYEIVLEAT